MAPPTRRRNSVMIRRIVLVAVMLVIAYIVYGLLQPGITTISNTLSMTLQNNQTQFIRIYNGSILSLKLTSVSAQGATFYVSQVPVLYSPVVSFTMPLLTGLNVSSGGSRVADMNIQLLSTSGTSATVQITPLTASLNIKPSPGVSLLNPASLSNIGKGTTNYSASTSVTVTTTATGSTAPTTVASNSTSQLFQTALNLMNSAGIGVLMTNYNKLYQKDVACNQTVYNATYNTYYHTLPPAPISFANISQFTPTGVNVTELALPAPNNVQVTYLVKTPSKTYTGPVIIAIVNTTSFNFISKLTYTGLYNHLNYTTLNASYNFQNKILNNCGAYISPPPTH